jgi:hypothetical protein
MRRNDTWPQRHRSMVQGACGLAQGTLAAQPARRTELSTYSRGFTTSATQTGIHNLSAAIRGSIAGESPRPQQRHLIAAREVGATRLLAAWCALGPVASRLFSSPLQSLWPGAWRGLLRSSPPPLWASANASPTLESAPALPAAALPREVAAKAPPTHLYPEPPPPSVSPGLTASSPPTAPASGRAMATQLTSWTRLPCRWSPVALALAAGACGWR